MLNLFPELLVCGSCGHGWRGYAHGFMRGHTVLTRNGRIALIPDDLSYAFLDAIDRAAEIDPVRRLGDFADPLRQLGWRDLEACPVCGGRSLTPRYEPNTEVVVPCTCFDSLDFEPTASGWALTEAGRAKERLA